MACDATTDESTLLQGLQSVRKHHTEQTADSKLLESLRDVANSFTKDGVVTMTPEEVNAAVGTANDVLQTMFPTFAAQHELAERELAHAIGAIQACHDMHAGDESVRLQRAVVRAEAAKVQCDGVLEEAVAHENEICTGEVTFSCVQGAQNNHNQLGSFRGYTKERCEQECAENADCLSYDSSSNGGNECYLSTTTAESGGGLRANDARYVYCEKSVAEPNCLCDEAREASTAQTALCEAASETYSNVYCDSFHSCTSFAECHAKETETYRLLREDIEEAMRTRQQQYRTYMQSNCLLELISTAMASGTPIPKASLVACDDVSVDDLTLAFPDPPAEPAECPADQNCHVEEPPALVGAISHGSMVHLRNQYGPRHYLDTCGHNSCGGAGQFNVVASPSRTRGAGTGTWEMIKTSGSGPVSHGDHVHIRNQYGTKNYLDSCGMASCGGGYSVQAHLEPNRGGHMTGTWEIVRENGEEGPIVHGDIVHFQNQYNDKTWLDACGHARCGGGYEVSTHAVRNRGNHRTGSWEILLVDAPQ